MRIESETGKVGFRKIFGPLLRLGIPTGAIFLLLAGNAYGASGLVSLQITTQVTSIGSLLTQVAYGIAAALFVLAGIFYAIGQMLPPDKKAAYHTTAVNIIIGAIVMAALSFAATGFATASTHLLVNSTVNTLTSNT